MPEMDLIHISAWCAAFALTLLLAAWLTPRAWWRRPNLRALAVLGGGTLAFGLLFAAWWGDPAAAPQATAAALRVLDSPRFLRHAAETAAANATSSADRLGLSRSAFSFEPVTEGYRIARLSPTQALYHLDPDLNFVAAIGEATADAPYTLPAGHHLVAGHYVLRFDA